MLPRAMDFADVPTLLFAACRFGVLEQHLTVADHCVKRGPELVTHPRQELRFRLIGALGFDFRVLELSRGREMAQHFALQLGLRCNDVGIIERHHRHVDGRAQR